MKHYFIINPQAGHIDRTAGIRKLIEAYEEWVDFDWETYVTTGPGDAAVYTHLLCEEHPQETIRLYACGGDGTLNEVATGAMGHPNAQVALYPSGSGNDFLRNFGEKGDFRDLDRLVNGAIMPIDVIRIVVGRGEDAPVRYCLNVAGLGFDGSVAYNMQKIKRWPVLGGKRAYDVAVLWTFLFARKHRAHIVVDGKPFDDTPFLFTTFCNGRYEGGGFNGAPLAKVDDGLLDIYRIHAIPIHRFPSLLALYRNGDHVDNPQCRDVIDFTQGTDVEIECPKPVPVTIDGEVLRSDYYRFELLHNALDFVLPKGLMGCL